MLNWTKAQWEAFGRHVLTAVSSALAMAVALNLTTAAQAGELLAHATHFITALIGLIAIVGPLYAAIQASRSASPANQVDAVVKNLSATPAMQATDAAADPQSREKIIEAVAGMPEVKKVELKDPALAKEIPSAKVV